MKRSKRRGWKYWTWRVVRLAALFWITSLIVFWALQNWLIFPGASTQGCADALVRPEPDQELLTLKTSTGDTIAALFAGALTPAGQPHPQAYQRPTIIYFYGNGMCMADATYELPQLRRMGVNVLLTEFVGYGMSSGRPSEKGCYATADAAYDHLLTRPGIDTRLIVPMGWSLGSAAAADLASRRPVAGLVMCSAFTSMADMARRHAPFLPVSVLLQHRFENARKLADLSIPLFLSHGQRDGIVPFEMSPRLAKAASRCAVTTFWVPKADHNDLFFMGGEPFYAALEQFINQLQPVANP